MGLLDVTIAAMANQAMNYLVTGKAPTMMGNAHPNIVPYEAYKAADHYIILATGNDGQYQRFCDVAGRADLAEDARFATNRDRVENRGVLGPILRDIIAAQSRSFWLAELEKVGVPCGPINNLEQVFDDPHVQARGARREVEHPAGGLIPTVANPIRLSESPIQYERAPPALGQHTDDVLADMLGMDAAGIAKLREDDVI
jgi:crotonobetainyl-CoA:carnitine CoA-transferase CaiB-like acyl-CoA transferase